MGRVAERAEVRVMGCGDEDAAARGQQAVEFFHGPDDIGNMLDDVDGAHLPKRIVAEGEREMVQVADDVGFGVGVAVEPDRTRVFVDSAADVENGQLVKRAGDVRGLLQRCYCSSALRHSSSVSTAKSAWSRVMTNGGQRRMLF